MARPRASFGSCSPLVLESLLLLLYRVVGGVRNCWLVGVPPRARLSVCAHAHAHGRRCGLVS